MGWNIDLSAITPGPGGTVMLGEGGIDAAARRYRERVRKQQEAEALAKAKNGETQKGDDAASEVTLTPEGDEELKRNDRKGDGVGDASSSGKKAVAVEEETGQEKEQGKDKKKKEKKGLREAWRGFRGVR
ncbi:hypothetical protein P168DRAFT_292397 [Aspergillus campestris IBT 28561]|uniref:Uncharacterized protein n=1 Tax=Aspergillus campestris (strain IBT 28561) TaxID=1392248 RepID=A0A2I1CXH0_ASPC2|nr:uncharacterized protein P168DRAFT_292397 [Aspergillus campestris IBT 28561]PKY02311.1 hypothetical protein P168DRAFT_292397 [Aspergillus campestris IBT 28561]